MVQDKLSQWIKRTIHRPSEQSAPKSTNTNKPLFIQKKPDTVSINPDLRKKAVKIIPLGGLEEVGKNMTAIEYGNDIIIIDMGFQFPESSLLGIDYILPDITYLKNKLHKIKGVFITHGHLDHIGGIPYLIEQLGSPPIYSTKLTIALIKKRLEEFKIESARLHVIEEKDQIRAGVFNVGFYHITHSIPDCVGIIVNTPEGIIVHTGDFKFDATPSDNKVSNYAKIASLSEKNVIALLCESTNSLVPGRTVSEKQIGESLDEIIENAKGRVIIASFSSLIGRVQHVINAAIKYKKRIYISGRSMEENLDLATRLGYLKVTPGLIHKIKKGSRSDEKDAVIITTGSQGEEVSALSRMTFGTHAHIKIIPGDTVILSSNPIPGNEEAVRLIINNLCQLGANVISTQITDVHTSGHAHQEELKLMIELVKPKYLIPVHGDLYMRMGLKTLAENINIPSKKILLLNNGEIAEISNSEIKKSAEKAESNIIMVERSGISNIGEQIITERKLMAESGMITIVLKTETNTKRLIGKPEVISRGFIYMRESKDILEEVISLTVKSYEEIQIKDPRAKRTDLKNYIKNRVDRMIRSKIEKTPLILPVIINI